MRVCLVVMDCCVFFIDVVGRNGNCIVDVFFRLLIRGDDCDIFGLVVCAVIFGGSVGDVCDSDCCGVGSNVHFLGGGDDCCVDDIQINSNVDNG